MPPQTFYVFECLARGCVAEFYLNDIPIIRRGSGVGLEYGGQVNQYLVDGTNELTIVVNPGPVPGEAGSITTVDARKVATDACGTVPSTMLIRKMFLRASFTPFSTALGTPLALP